MLVKSTSSVRFDARITSRNHDGSWVAYVEPTGMTLHGQTREEAIQNAKNAVDSFIRTVGQHDGIGAVRKYLDYHEVLHSVVEERPESAVQNAHIDVRLEVAAIA